MSRAVALIALIIVIASPDLYAIDSIAQGVNDARETQYSSCTPDLEITNRLAGVSVADPLVLHWPVAGKISEYNSNQQARTHKVLLGYGSWWVNDEGLNSDGSENGGSHYCWNGGYYVSSMSACERVHSGIDINRKADDATNNADDPDAADRTHQQAVFPIFPGRVLTVGTYPNGWQDYIIIQHDSRGGGNYNFVSLYAHLEDVRVQAGHVVTINTRLASVTDLDNATVHDRDHLHLGIMMLGTNGSGMDNIARGALTLNSSLDEPGHPDNKYINPSPLCLGVVNQVVRWEDRLFFPDVSEGQWYYGYIKALFDEGVVEGYPDGTYQPARNVNRVEFLKMAIEGSSKLCCDDCTSCQDCTNCGGDQLPFSDVSAAQWYYPYVRAAHYDAWIADQSSEFFPGIDAKRSWVAEILVNSQGGQNYPCIYGVATSPFMDILDENICDEGNIAAWRASELGLFEGYDGVDCDGHATTGRYFCGENTLNRAEAAKVIEAAFLKDGSQW